MIPFVKYAACGNDFILIDNRHAAISHPIPAFLSSLCHRHFGIGADGVIFLEASSKADAKMRIFNSDGSEAEMCGNGLRCLISWISEQFLNQQKLQIETLPGIFKGYSMGNGQIAVQMMPPQTYAWDESIEYDGESVPIDYLDTGVPHVVRFVEDSEAFALNAWGKFIRHHARWQPRGTNVTIGQRLDAKTFRIRTYERGVEGETLACGTGAAAFALAAARKYPIEGPLNIITRSMDTLTIDFKREKLGSFNHITMIGPAIRTFSGTFNVNAFMPSPNNSKRMDS